MQNAPPPGSVGAQFGFGVGWNVDPRWAMSQQRWGVDPTYMRMGIRQEAVAGAPQAFGQMLDMFAAVGLGGATQLPSRQILTGAIGRYAEAVAPSGVVPLTDIGAPFMGAFMGARDAAIPIPEPIKAEIAAGAAGGMMQRMRTPFDPFRSMQVARLVQMGFNYAEALRFADLGVFNPATQRIIANSLTQMGRRTSAEDVRGVFARQQRGMVGMMRGLVEPLVRPEIEAATRQEWKGGSFIDAMITGSQDPATATATVGAIAGMGDRPPPAIPKAQSKVESAVVKTIRELDKNLSQSIEEQAGKIITEIGILSKSISENAVEKQRQVERIEAFQRMYPYGIKDRAY
jgi:hypothetical protein